MRKLDTTKAPLPLPPLGLSSQLRFDLTKHSREFAESITERLLLWFYTFCLSNHRVTEIELSLSFFFFFFFIALSAV